MRGVNLTQTTIVLCFGSTTEGSMKKGQMSKAQPLRTLKPKKPISPSAELYLQRYLKALYLVGESKK